ncbi:MAG: ABC transporter permease [Paludibacteraceae bacterium]|jgi:phospholipid/cholesterol/gamma-HCH transport system permease protein|nr:ABC transporter permease [Bacteroidales bacterium]MBO5131829.1 ABC transporter permease [Paludibacteraceae bacterium]MBO5827460.1 ABC transporter permease [Paludibacteraceae bacterium]MBR6659590.1 ABC transporter permease [Paludibacteraceae bacterium]MEE0911408.1 ABC transporter permease [Paludibacteraceae bacterium]
MNAIEKVGEYASLMYRTITKPDRWSIFWKQYVNEVKKQGIDSLWIVVIISTFIGAVITIQMVLNTENPLLPTYSTGLATRDTLLLEFSSSIMCLILAGKVGSNIASEIGTMRITEQIDALDIMGVNSANYLILPKITAFMTIIPCLVLVSMFVGIIGGYCVGIFTDIITVHDYEVGIQYAFIPFYVTYSVIKGIVFAFIISSVSSYYGYTVKGGALEVGKSSTDAVVNSSVLILLFNVMLTKLLLT